MAVIFTGSQRSHQIFNCHHTLRRFSLRPTNALLSTSFPRATKLRAIFVHGLDTAKSETPVRIRKSMPRNIGINLKLKAFQQDLPFASDVIVTLPENRFTVDKHSVQLQIIHFARILFLFCLFQYFSWFLFCVAAA